MDANTPEVVFGDNLRTGIAIAEGESHHVGATLHLEPNYALVRKVATHRRRFASKTIVGKGALRTFHQSAHPRTLVYSYSLIV